MNSLSKKKKNNFKKKSLREWIFYFWIFCFSIIDTNLERDNALSCGPEMLPDGTEHKKAVGVCVRNPSTVWSFRLMWVSSTCDWSMDFNRRQAVVLRCDFNDIRLRFFTG